MEMILQRSRPCEQARTAWPQPHNSQLLRLEDCFRWQHRQSSRPSDGPLLRQAVQRLQQLPAVPDCLLPREKHQRTSLVWKASAVPIDWT
jgi:hypothetical protein